MKREKRLHLITDAPRSPEEELRARERRYVLMMSIRALCVILGGILVITRPPLLGVWLVICVVGAVALPWISVLLANDKAPRPEQRLRNKLHRTPKPEPAAPMIAPVEHKVIDEE